MCFIHFNVTENAKISHLNTCDPDALSGYLKVDIMQA